MWRRRRGGAVLCADSRQVHYVPSTGVFERDLRGPGRVLTVSSLPMGQVGSKWQQARPPCPSAACRRPALLVGGWLLECVTAINERNWGAVAQYPATGMTDRD